MSYISMTAEDLAEVARLQKPFATDGNGGVDRDPEVVPGGTWRDIQDLMPVDVLKVRGTFKLRIRGSTAVLAKYEPPKPAASVDTTRGVPTKTVNADQQNQHAWSMLNDRDLSPAELAVGMRLHYYCFAPSSGMKCTKPAATLAAHCGMSESTFRRSSAVLVKRGYFRRIDNGKGGSRGTNRSAYVPTVPEWAQLT